MVKQKKCLAQHWGLVQDNESLEKRNPYTSPPLEMDKEIHIHGAVVFGFRPHLLFKAHHRGRRGYSSLSPTRLARIAAFLMLIS